MRNERKYKIITLLTTVLALLLLGTCVREPFRLAAATERQYDEYILKGAKAYAENCMQCHGPRGEGVIGMPLNQSNLKVDYASPAGKEVYNRIYNTLLMGRKGNDLHFKWEKTPDGKWISYSTMPAWGKEYGGPYDSDYLKALTLFIMHPDGSQWGIVGTSDAPPQPADLAADKEEDGKKVIPLPNAKGLSDADNASAKALLRNLGKSQCLTCHVIGPKGGKIGPDLTYTGSWGVDQKFLEDWIKYANQPQPNDQDKTAAIAHNARMPVYWSANRASTSPELNLKNPVESEGPYYMPRFKGRLTDEEITLIARYLMGLKAGE